ncbi:MAG: uncharacterized protein KVP18_001110 [Porospora cf. gigantea A]|uniref:uncharacterized protein n=1 Tax=Porospora cf. gigantea A TaxID=2853593 RepID=UPI00355A0E3D|nr:MAG: hypothetical protein KVP18_001110 [Porospora cf. gigantea A]
MNVNNLITAVRLHFTEYEYVQRIESDFGIDIDSLADAILNQFMTGLNAPVSPVRNVDMATWTSHVHEEFRVLNAIRDGGVFSSLDAAVAAFFTPEENAGYPEEHRKFHNLAVIARTPFYVVRAIGFNAFIDLMDMAVRISPIFSVPDIDVHRRTRVSTRHSCVRTHLSRHCVRCLKPLESMSITVGIAVIKAVLIRGSQLLVRPVPRAELRGWASRLNE